MAYASWSVSFGEQPSAAKWNILGTNDSSFNDGTGLPHSTSAVTRVAASETTISTSYTALPTAQAATCTVTANGKLLVSFGAQSCANNTAVAFCYMTPVLSGTNTLAASDTYCAMHQDASANVARSKSMTHLFTGLNAGSTTVTMNFKVATGGSGAGTGTWVNRSLQVIPL